MTFKEFSRFRRRTAWRLRLPVLYVSVLSLGLAAFLGLMQSCAVDDSYEELQRRDVQVQERKDW